MFGVHLDGFFLFIHIYKVKEKNIHRVALSISGPNKIKRSNMCTGILEVVFERTCFAFYIKKGGIQGDQICANRIFSLIHYIHLTERYNLDEYMIVLIRKHNN